MGIMKEFVTPLDKGEYSFHYICKTISGLSAEKFEGGLFDGP